MQISSIHLFAYASTTTELILFIFDRNTPWNHVRCIPYVRSCDVAFRAYPFIFAFFNKYFTVFSEENVVNLIVLTWTLLDAKYTHTSVLGWFLAPKIKYGFIPNYAFKNDLEIRNWPRICTAYFSSHIEQDFCKNDNCSHLACADLSLVSLRRSRYILHVDRCRVYL